MPHRVFTYMYRGKMRLPQEWSNLIEKAIFPGQFKISGHSDVKHRKGFASMKKRQEQISRTKGYVTKGNNKREAIQRNLKQSSIPRLIMLILRCGFVIGLFLEIFFMGKAALFIDEVHIQETDQYLRKYESMQEQETLMFFVKSANYYYQGGDWNSALAEYERALKLAADDDFVIARIYDLKCRLE